MSKTARNTPFSMRLKPTLKAKLQALADAENRSLTNFIETALQRLADSYETPKKGKAA